MAINRLNLLARFELFDFDIPNNYGVFQSQMRQIAARGRVEHFTLGQYTTQLERHDAHAIITNILSALNPNYIRRLSMHLVDYPWNALLGVFQTSPELLPSMLHLELKIGDRIYERLPEIDHDMPMEILQYICDKAANLTFLHFSNRNTVCFYIKYFNLKINKHFLFVSCPKCSLKWLAWSNLKI